MTTLLIIAIVLLIGILGALAWFYFKVYKNDLGKITLVLNELLADRIRSTERIVSRLDDIIPIMSNYLQVHFSDVIESHEASYGMVKSSLDGVISKWSDSYHNLDKVIIEIKDALYNGSLNAEQRAAMASDLEKYSEEIMKYENDLDEIQDQFLKDITLSLE